MGCCISAPNQSPVPNSPHISKSTSTKQSKSPPPSNPILEEESVKEVLSETPTIPRQPSRKKFQDDGKIDSPLFNAQPGLFDQEGVKPKQRRQMQSNGGFEKPFMAFNPDRELSEEASEIGSIVSESVYVPANVTEKRENGSANDDDVGEIRYASPAGLKTRSFSAERRRERAVVKSPAKRSNPSPRRVRPGPGMSSPNGYAKRRDSGESSGWRSSSPVTRVDGDGPNRPGLGRSQSGRRTEKSLSRTGSGLSEKARKVVEEESGKWAPTSGNESLENPLVSLECFIFL